MSIEEKLLIELKKPTFYDEVKKSKISLPKIGELII
jgi:hypothetical protein